MTRLHLAALILAAAGTASAVSPYINKVYDYRPAPGQFINSLPEYEPGDTHADMIAKVEEAIAFDRSPGAISLGAFGGYVVFGFDHPIINVPGEYDLKIFGNAIISDRNAMGGACEPGIVWVSRDDNANGQPDDIWYQLAGSEYSSPATRHNFAVTYSRPAAEHVPTPDPADRHITDSTYIPWTASDDTTGYLTANDFNPGNYWPAWLEEQELSFTGECLAGNAVDTHGDGSYYVLKMLPWGYADNCPNGSDPGFKIDWAVDAEGQPVALPSIDFVKVVTGMHQTCGSLGETSTEVCGAEDLHPSAAGVSDPRAESCTVVIRGGTLSANNPGAPTCASLLNMQGRKAATLRIPEGHSLHTLPTLPPGIYLLSIPGCPVLKFSM